MNLSSTSCQVNSLAGTQGRWACPSRDYFDMPGLIVHRLSGMRVCRIVRVAISSHFPLTMQQLENLTSTFPTCSSACTVGVAPAVMEETLALRSNCLDADMRSFFGRHLLPNPPDSAARSLPLYTYFVCFLVCNIYLSGLGEHAFASN